MATDSKVFGTLKCEQIHRVSLSVLKSSMHLTELRLLATNTITEARSQKLARYGILYKLCDLMPMPYFVSSIVSLQPKCSRLRHLFPTILLTH